MNLTYKALLLWGPLMASLTVSAQSTPAPPCPANGITTDPAAPVNPQEPSQRNAFDWNFTASKPNYDVNWFFTGQRPYLETPYDQPSNPNNDVDYLQGIHDSPSSGWELIKKDLGYTSGPNSVPNQVGVHNPYVIVYNKYTGVLRVFWAIGDRQSTDQFCSIELGFGPSSYNTASKTGLLNRVAGIGISLQNTSPGTDQVLTVVKAFSNTFGAWFVADFPMEYDPCTCLKQSTVSLKVKLISQAQVALSSTSTGVLASINNGSGSGPAGSSNRATLAGRVHGANTAINGVTSAFNSPYDFASHALGGSDAGVVKRFADALNSVGFLRQGLKALPYVGSAMSVLDFFLGGGQDNGPQQVSVQPMSIDFTTTTSGTITYSNDYSGARFSTPGSQERTQYLEEYPSYNETLGVVNLLVNPQIDVVNSGFDSAYPTAVSDEYGYTYYTGPGGPIQHLFHLKKDLPYVVNPASGLRVKEMQASLRTTLSLVYPPNDNTASGLAAAKAAAEANVANGSLGDFSVLGKPVGDAYLHQYEVSTPFVDVGCLGGTVLTLPDVTPGSGPGAYTGHSNYYSRGRLYLKLMINLERINPTATNQNTLMVLTFPVDEQAPLTNAAPGSNPGGADPYPADDQTLFGPLPACTASTPLTPAVSAAEISDFCLNDPAYRAAIALRPGHKITVVPAPPTKHADNQALTQFECYPNPTLGTGTIQFSLAEPDGARLFLLNELGVEVKQLINADYDPGFHKVSFDTQTLAPGIYHCVLQTSHKREVIKIVVVR